MMGQPQRRRVRKKLISLIGVLLLLLTGCKKEKAPQQAIVPEHLNVVLISIDTLRADFLRLYSSAGIETPAMEKLATSGVTFDRVVSQVPYTLPSHVTMLTGMYPTAHSVRDNVRDVLPAKISTVAEQFRNQHYQTAGFVGSMVLSRNTGLNRGFDFYDDSFSRADVHSEDLGAIERSAEDVFHSFQHWFQNRDSRRNFFAFLHFYDPHSPYSPPRKFTPKTREVRSLYEGEIRYVDAVLEQLFGYLKQPSVWNSTVILVTSDHGELLGEHQETGHGFFLYQPALHVPFIVHDPAITSGNRIRDVVEIVDVTPTLLQYGGITVSDSVQGESLLPLIRGTGKKKKRTAYSESYFASLQFGISPQYSIQDDRYKYIDTPEPELYDLSNDSVEQTNLAAQQKDRSAKLRQALQQFRNTTTGQLAQQGQRTVSAEEAEQFAALGYLGGNVPESSWDRTKDPKDYIDLWNDSLKTTYLMNQNQFQAALPIIQKLQKATAKHSTASLLLLEARCYTGLGQFAQAEQTLKPLGSAPEALSTLAGIYETSGRIELAESTYREALKKQYSPFVLYNYLLLLKKTGRAPEGLVLLEKVRKEQPDTEQSRSFLAESYFLLGNLQESERYCLNFVETRPWEMKWYLQLAATYQMRGDVQKALMLLTSNRERFIEKPDYWWRLGILYKHLQNPSGEIQSFQEMLKVSPEDARGYFYLAKAMLDQRQNISGVIQLAERGMQLGPDPSMQVFGHYILGEAYEYAGRTEDARREIEMARKLEKLYG